MADAASLIAKAKGTPAVKHLEHKAEVRIRKRPAMKRPSGANDYSDVSMKRPASAPEDKESEQSSRKRKAPADEAEKNENEQEPKKKKRKLKAGEVEAGETEAGEIDSDVEFVSDSHLTKCHANRFVQVPEQIRDLLSQAPGKFGEKGDPPSHGAYIRAFGERKNKYFQVRSGAVDGGANHAIVQVSQTAYGEFGHMLASVMLALWNEGWQRHSLQYVKGHALQVVDDPLE